MWSTQNITFFLLPLHLRISKLYFSFFKGDAKKGRGKDKLVVETMFNPSKSAIVVDSHIKNPTQSRGDSCLQSGERCTLFGKSCCNIFCYDFTCV